MKGIVHNVLKGVGTVMLVLVLGAFQDAPQTEKDAGKINWVTLDELETLHADEPRKVFIDIYATWCGPCKLMDKKTFADPQIVEYVNEHYYAIKLNGEGKKQVKLFGKTMSEAELAYAFRIQGYPSIVFMDEKLQPYQPVAGYIPAKNFIQMLRQFNEEEVN